MTPLLMIPGMMCDARLFLPQIEAFSAERPVHIAVMNDHETMEDLARSVLETAPEKFCLLGLSMGGILAMEIMRQAAGRAERIALLDTNPLAEAEAAQKRRLPQIEAAQRGELARIMREEMKPNYLVDSPQKSAILDLCMAMAEALGPKTFISQSRALMSRPDQQDTLRAIDIPALVLCGRSDVLCPAERHHLMHELIPNSNLEMIDGAGHLPVLEQADLTNQKIREWLDR